MRDYEQPNDLRCERAVLGAIALGLGFPTRIETADFYLHTHELIFEALAGLAAENTAIDLVSLAAELRRRNNLGLVGGEEYLLAITDGLPRVLNIEHYASVVRRCARQRAALRAALDIADRVQRREDLGELAGAFLAGADAVSGEETAGDDDGLGVEQIESLTRDYALHIDQHRQRTGIAALDEHLGGGLGPGQVLTILARTGAGKSALAQNVLSAFIAGRQDGSAVFVSAEMPPEEFWVRQRQIEATATEGRVLRAYRDGEELSPGWLDRAKQRVFVIPHPGLTLRVVERMIVRAHRSGRIQKPAYVMLDYLGLFSAQRAAGRGNVEEYGEIARGAKILAKRLKVACVLIVQAARRAGSGTTPVTLTDARMSGEIEEACDFLLGMWRPEVGKDGGDEKLLRLALLKARRAPLRKWDVTLDGPTLRVSA